MFIHIHFLKVRIKLKIFKITSGINELILTKQEEKQKLATKKSVSAAEPFVDADISDQHTMKINGILGSQLHVSYQLFIYFTLLEIRRGIE